MSATAPQAVQSCHELPLWLIPQLDKFPCLRRYTLSERIEGDLIWGAGGTSSPAGAGSEPDPDIRILMGEVLGNFPEPNS